MTLTLDNVKPFARRGGYDNTVSFAWKIAKIMSGILAKGGLTLNQTIMTL